MKTFSVGDQLPGAADADPVPTVVAPANGSAYIPFPTGPVDFDCDSEASAKHAYVTSGFPVAGLYVCVIGCAPAVTVLSAVLSPHITLQ